MPKLPGWQPSISTAMPRKSAALQNAPAMVQPAVQRFVPLNDPGDYIRLGAAKANKYAAIGNAVNTVANVALKVVEEDEAARANNAVAQYSEEMAKWTTATVKDPSLYTEQENPDGSVSKVYHWEDAEERYEEKAKEVQDRLLKDNNFRTQRARLGLERGFTSNDEQFRTKVQGFVANRRVDRGRANDMEALDTYKETGNIEAIEALRNDMIQGGRWNASAAYNVTGAAIRTASYNQTVKQIQMLNSQDDVSTLMKQIQAGEGWGKDMTVQQRQQVIAEGQERILGMHYEDMRLLNNNGGPNAALSRLNALADGGPQASGAMDEVSHMKMIGHLRTGMDRLAKIDADRYVGQSASNINGMYFGGLENLDMNGASSLTYQLRTKKNRDIVDGKANEFLQMFDGQPQEAFYASGAVNDQLIMGARVNHIATPYKSKIESDIRGGSPFAAAKVRQIESIVPGAFRGLSEDVRKKIEYIETHQDLNLPGDVNQDFAAVQNMSKADRDIYAEIERTNLKNEPPEEAFAASRERLGIDSDGFFSDTTSSTDPRVEAFWKTTYSEYLPFVKGDHNKASDAATRAVQRRFGVSTANGDQRYEEDSPEVIYQSAGREPGMPSPDFDAQYQYHIDDLNLRLEAGDKEERYTREDTRRQYLGVDPQTKEHRWILHDMAGNPVMESDGVVFTMGFDPAGINAEADQITSNNEVGLAHVQTTSAVVANAGFEPATFDDAPQNPVSGMIAPTVTLAVDLNETRWSKIGDAEKEEHNWAYQAAFNAVVDENRRLLFANEASMAERSETYAMSRESKMARAELQAHLFLATRGYMRGGTDGNYIRPPGGY